MGRREKKSNDGAQVTEREGRTGGTGEGKTWTDEEKKARIK
jgi:hypothetical protein